MNGFGEEVKDLLHMRFNGDQITVVFMCDYRRRSKLASLGFCVKIGNTEKLFSIFAAFVGKITLGPF